MTEPHRLTSVLQCIVRVARPLVSGGRKRSDEAGTYPEGPTHVIPLLLSSLPGVDPNDIPKCMVSYEYLNFPLYMCNNFSDYVSIYGYISVFNSTKRLLSCIG